MNFRNNPKLPSILNPWLKPPDPPNEDALMQNNQSDVKGEYIEDCDAIKEETQDISDHSKQVPAQQMPHYSQYYPVPNNYSSNMPTMQPNTSQQNLTPLQLIQQLSSYAVTGNKRKDTSPSKGTGSKKKKLQEPKSHHAMKNTAQQQLPDTSVGGNPSLSSSVTVVGEASANNNKTVTADDIPCPVSRSMIDCPVCGDTAVAHFHYGGMCCYSCKAFFRRVVNTNKVGIQH